MEIVNIYLYPLAYEISLFAYYLIHKGILTTRKQLYFMQKINWALVGIRLQSRHCSNIYKKYYNILNLQFTKG